MKPIVYLMYDPDDARRLSLELPDAPVTILEPSMRLEDSMLSIDDKIFAACLHGVKSEFQKLRMVAFYIQPGNWVDRHVAGCRDCFRAIKRALQETGSE